MKIKREKAEIKDFLGIVLLGLALILFLSLFSYTPRDIGFLYSTPNQPPENYVGIFGAWIGFVLFMGVGASAYWIPLLLAGWGVNYFLNVKERNLFLRLAAAVVLVMAFAMILHMQKLISPQHFIHMHNIPSFGGVLGEKIYESILYPYLGVKGSSIAILTAFTGCFLVLLQGKLILILKFAGQGIVKIKDGAQFLMHLGGMKKTRMPFAFAGKPQRKMRISGLEGREEEEEPPPRLIRREPPKINVMEPKPASAFKVAPKTVEIKRPSEPAPAVAKSTTSSATSAPVNFANYRLPTVDLLDDPPPMKRKEAEEDLQQNSQILENTLRDFGIEAQVIEVTRGPVITRYELHLAPGIKVQKITNLQDDIALAMRAASLRILAPIPGKAAVGIEVPNSRTTAVVLKELLVSPEFQNFKGELPLTLGKDVSGKPIVADLTTTPHLLIAGVTGSGKSVCVSSIIMNILFYATPNDVKFLMVDPKMVEMSAFNVLPHLITPVITDPKKVPMGLAWVINEMEKRYSVFARVGVRNIQGYNNLPAKNKQNPNPDEDPFPEKYPYIVVIIDELADLMMVAPADVENAITRLAQLSRAVGIHLILATQRPSVDVITGVIKANFPTRIAFQVSSKVDSRTILDCNGAEKLLGKGDLLFMPPGSSKLIRAQGTLVRDGEINRVLNFIKEQGFVWNPQDIFEQVKKDSFADAAEEDELYEDAVRIVMETQQASVSILQRRLRVGYTRAARLMDLMEAKGIVGPYKGSKARDILVEDGAPEEI